MGIFDNAKFGDKFKTRDGLMALYIGCYYNNGGDSTYHTMVLEHYRTIHMYKSDGTSMMSFSDNDIVDIWN